MKKNDSYPWHLGDFTLLQAEDTQLAQEVDRVGGQDSQLGLFDVNLGDKVLDAGKGVAVDGADAIVLEKKAGHDMT